MSAPKHTPGPWKYRFNKAAEEAGVKFVKDIVDRNGESIAERAVEPDAARIVACVNACEGIEDPLMLRVAACEALSHFRVQALMGDKGAAIMLERLSKALGFGAAEAKEAV
jgi:hypothetical protein